MKKYYPKVIIVIIISIIVLAIIIYQKRHKNFCNNVGNKIVAKIKKENMAPGNIYRFKVGKLWDVDTIKRINENNLGNQAGEIWGQRTKEGFYKISIIKKDRGHAGLYGYLYSELEIQKQEDPYIKIITPGPLHQLKAKINKNWWFVYSNLN